ncbi:hypothetical protein JCM8097_001240 [Rhodosporidiobolus ruineniae]
MPPRLLPATFSVGLGQGVVHRLPDKLRAAAAAGLKGIEVFYPCLEAYAKEFDGETERDKLRSAARETGKLAQELGLDLFVLQPLLHYDGLKDPKEHKERLQDAKSRFELCKLLGCDMMQIPANFRLDDGVTGDEEKVVADLQELADLGAKEDPPIRFAYEGMCWSTFNYTWQRSWNIVQKVDRPNFGIVLDAFHIAGYEFANPVFPSGTRVGGLTRLVLSLEELARTFSLSKPANLAKVFYLQLADAELVDPPLSEIGAAETSKSPFHVDGQQPRMSWSRNCRLYPGEKERGGYMPIERVFKAFLETGYEGYLSFEVFHRELFDKDPELPKRNAERAMRSWARLQQDFKL